MTSTSRGRERRPLAEFIRDETTGGVVLAGATVVALLWANIAPGSYDDLWSSTIGPSSPVHLHLDLHAWVNDALMAIFFFVVGLEIKRELVVGELNRARDAAMPVIAALGGMALPALIYFAFNMSGGGRAGWGIPIATDIAFVLGALSLLGSRAPTGLRLFLLAVAIIDDIGAIIVIALFYSDGIDFAALAGAAGMVVVVVAMRRLNVTQPIAYVLPALALWLLLHESGVHATIAGVALGLLTPARPVGGRAVLDDLEDRLHPVSALAIVPLFALANAGVTLSSDALRDAATSTIAWGVVLGLVVGKTVGITGAALLARRWRVGTLPDGVDTRHLVGGAALAGIGFTVALFVADLTFGGTDRLAEAKIAILVASIVAGTLGALILARHHRDHGGRRS
ncbi:MAG: Na+/H+ antiporter NhaA [Acidimicrobiales bacterium]